MLGQNFNNRSVSQHQFAMVPVGQVPRSRFEVEHAHKTTFEAGRLIPILLLEVLPGDHFQTQMTAFVRMATPLFPVMDNFHLDSHFFFVPNRLLWDNWVKMMGERRKPSDSISYTVPVLRRPDAAGASYGLGSIFDYLGIPGDGQITAPLVQAYDVNALPLRAYAMIYNEWFRDQNLQNPWFLEDDAEVPTGDGPDIVLNGQESTKPLRRGKRHDYFTSCLPWPLKGGVDVTLPLAGSAPIAGLAVDSTSYTTNQDGWEWAAGDAITYAQAQLIGSGVANPAGSYFVVEMVGGSGGANAMPYLRADLSQATGATINALRLAMATQQLLELDARGGTRYVEILRAHFGVTPQDARLQRPEFLGGGSSRVNITPVAQTSETGTTPLGSTGAFGSGVAQHGFSYAVPEHGFIMGIVSVRADLTYQQGLHRMWKRQTRYDYYWPVFANLGEQAVTRSEIYHVNNAALDDTVFGYQERWAEYRYIPSVISGLFRSTATGNIDEWHAAQQFTAPPSLNAAFIQEEPPMERVLAAGASAANMHFLGDFLFSQRMTRALPMYSRPGLTRF